MTKEEFALAAAAECNSAATSAHHGGGAGRPFWNPEAFQFMYVPSFHFQLIPGTKKYRYSAKDENGVIHTFESNNAISVLEPIWAEIPEGVVVLTVSALDDNGNETYVVGTRTFFKLAPFPADLPPAVCSYKECAAKALNFAMSQSFLRHWLTDGTPDPDYDHNVYPSKMIAAIITAMIKYTSLCPEKADDAMKIAVNAADYLIGITPTEGPMKGIPPTYQIDFRPDPETRDNLSAKDRLNWVMMIYPARVAISYLELEKKTGERRFFEAAEKIAEYFCKTVEENGSWFLIRDFRTGEVLNREYCDTLRIISPFLRTMYERTGNEEYKRLADNGIKFAESTLETYAWGGQFEDSSISANYSNLTHYGASALVRYYAKYFADDPEKMAIADELMRFIEDQFVIWKRPSPWNKHHFDTSKWLTPCGLEQYKWHVPIDASTADILSTFLAMYRAGRGELHLEKAKALADAITRSQQPDGMIPTHWMSETYLKGKNMWINCLLFAADALQELGEFLGE